MTSKESQQWEQKRYKEMISDLKKIDKIYVAASRKSNNQNWDKGIWRFFNVYYIKDNKLERVFLYDSLKESQKSKLWNKDTHSFESTVLGSDRIHEIVYSLYQKVYPYKKNQKNDALYKMPEIQFLSWFDGDNDAYDETEAEEGEL